MRIRHLSLSLAAAALLCAAAANAARPPAPTIKIPTQAEVMEMMNRNMGKAAITQQESTVDGVQVVIQTGHSAQISAVAASADGRFLLSAGMDETAKLWDVASGQELRTLTGFGMLGPRSVVIDPTGTRAVIADLTSIKVFDLASGRELRNFNSGALNNVIAADGRIAVVSDSFGSGRGPRLVDTLSGETLWSVPAEDETAVALSADGNTLLTQRVDAKANAKSASGEVNGELHVWDVPGRKLRAKLPADASRLGQITALSSDGKWLLTESLKDRTVSLSDTASGEKRLTLETDRSVMQGITDTLTFSPDGRMMAWASSSDSGLVWEVPSGKLLLASKATALGFSADSRTLLMARGAGGAPLRRNIESGVESPLSGGASAILDLVLTPDGNGVVAAMSDGGAILWDLSTGQIVRHYDCPSGAGASSVSISSAAHPLLATGCMDGSAWLWDFATGKSIRNVLAALPAKQFASTFARLTADGQRLAVALKQEVSVWDAASGQLLRRIALPEVAAPNFGVSRTADEPADIDPGVRAAMQAVQALALQPGGEVMAIGRSGQVALWSASSGQMLKIITGSGATSVVPAGAVAPQQMPGIPGVNAGALESLLKNLGAGATLPPGLISMTDPSEVLDTMESQMEGSRALAFSTDGRRLLMLGNHGPRVWDVAAGTEIRPPRPQSVAATFDPQRMMDKILNREMGGGEGSAFSPDGQWGARGHGRVITIWNIATGIEVAQLLGHTSDISSLIFAADGRTLISGGHDGAVRVWNLTAFKEQVALIALGRADYVAVTPDQYYRASKSRIKGVSFRVNGQLYPFEQFDLRFNRPDIVLERLGRATPALVQSYRYGYQHRLKKLGFTENMLGTDFHLPEAEIVTRDVPVSTTQQTLILRVRAHDDQFTLDRLNVFVNDVPVHGSAGLPASDQQKHELEQDVTVPLASGRNKIQISVLNQQGTESLKQTVYTNAVGAVAAADIYLVAIGVSQYQNNRYNLRYAAKDADDLSNAYQALSQRSGQHGQVHVLRLTDDKATRPQIQQARQWLAQAKVNDLVVVFAAGHGMTDAQSNYYFGTHDIDPQHPAVNGLPYAEFETLLDGIPALQKLLLLDTCFSGEIDKDAQIVVAQTDTAGAGAVKMRAFQAQRGVKVVSATDASPGTASAVPGGALSGDMLRFQQDWFADLRRGTGAAVISSSSGNEYSLEGEQWNNGVFTYSLLQGLKNGKADANGDHIVSVSELQAYVIEEVRTLTQGGQNPTARRENLDYDFPVY